MTPSRDFEAAARTILGRRLSDEETVRLSNYLDILVKWQRTHRLVGSGDRKWIIDKLLLDSLLFVALLPPDAKEIADLGSGAGFPGIPLAVVLPSARVCLIEARQKRTAFLAAARRELHLDNANIYSGRVGEHDFPPELSSRFDVVVGRCAGGPDAVIPISLLLVRPGGVVILSGAPRPTPLPCGEWRTVPGVRQGTLRRFAIVTRPADTAAKNP